MSREIENARALSKCSGYKTVADSWTYHSLVNNATPNSNSEKQAIGRLEVVESVQDVARHFNVNITTIYRLLHQYNASQTTDDLPRSGRPRVTTPRQDRQITRQHQRHPFPTASESARQTIGTHNRHIAGTL